MVTKNWSDKTVECIKKDKQENLEWVESHLKKRCCLFRLLDPEIDSKNHGFLNFQDTPLIPYDNLWLHNISEMIYFYILKILSKENDFFFEKEESLT